MGWVLDGDRVVARARARCVLGGATLPPSRKGTRWDEVLLILVVYRLLSPGSEWRLHREWYGRSALADLLDTDEVIDPHALYDCHDLLLEHKAALFDHLVSRWRDLFNISFDVRLYDLTSTYFEIDPPLSDSDKRQFGYSRDKRSDCVQVVIALIVTPQGFPLAYVLTAPRKPSRSAALRIDGIRVACRPARPPSGHEFRPCGP